MQSITFDLSARNTTTLKTYHGQNVQKSPVDHMGTAYGRYKRKLDSANQARDEHANRMKVDIPVRSKKGKVPKTAHIHKLANAIKKRKPYLAYI